MSNAIAKIVTLAAGAGLSGTFASAEGEYRGYESPRYVVERELTDAVTVRSYDPHLLAQVRVSGDRGQALNRGFQVLAGYIFGGNTAAASVAMTSPVTQQQSQSIAMTSPVTQTGSGGVWDVTFMMPSEYTLETLPTPENENVRFYYSEPERHIVLTFSGFANDGALAKQERALRDIAQDEGLQIEGNPIFHFYDDPFTAPWRRRNEVAFQLG